jgi:hypothetical protein
MKFIYFIFLILILFNSRISCQDKKLIYNISVQENYFNNPEDSIKLLEKAINENDPIKFVSYFPIEQDMGKINFTDLSLRLGMINPLNNKYYPGFEKMLLIKLITDYSVGYNWVKMKIIENDYPNYKSSMIVKDKKEIEKIFKILNDITETKIKLDSTEKIKYDGNSLYEYSEAYIYICNLYHNDKLLSDSMMIKVEKIDNKWRVVSVSF